MRERLGFRNATLSAGTSEGKQLFHKRVTDMRKKGIHVSTSIFKYNLYQHVQMNHSAAELADFAKAIVTFIEQYNFNGFEFSWSPFFCRRCKNVDSQQANKDSMDFVRRLSEAFKPRGWLLSAAIAANKTDLDKIDILKFSE